MNYSEPSYRNLPSYRGIDSPTKKPFRFRPIAWLTRMLIWLFTFVMLVALPFIALVRGAVWTYIHYEVPSYLALAAGAAIAAILLLIYFILAYGLLLGWKKLSWKALKLKMAIAGLLLLGYCGYTLLYFSSKQAKSTEVHEEFQLVHPLLRVGVGTFVLLDPDMVVTDLARVKGDYKKMGLKTLNNSLHYKQKDGYVHAMDLRTNDRQEWRNQLLEFYFKAMGFNTLRHVGTADHLHVSISPHDYPSSI